MKNNLSAPQNGGQFEKVGEFVAIYCRSGAWYVICQQADRQVRRSLRTKCEKEARRRALIIEKKILGGWDHEQRKRGAPRWTRSQVDKILAATTAPFTAPLAFLAETGMRVGEAKWLTWGDVDFERRLIHIRSKEGWRPKSGDARVVPMSDRLVGMLTALPPVTTWVFIASITTRTPSPGRQISERRLQQHLRPVLKRLGLNGDLHTFRDSFFRFAVDQ